MREFAFSIEYDRGVDPLADALAGETAVRSTGLACPLGPDSFWRLDRVRGPPDAVAAAKAALTEEHQKRTSISGRACSGDHRRSLLADDPRHCVVYTYVDEATECDAVELLAGRYADGGVLCGVERRGRTERWRVLLQDDRKVGILYDALGGRLGEGATFRFDHLQDAEGAPLQPETVVSVRPEQRRVLEAAVERGYYETPRETTLDEIAAALDCPRSTVSYRLRRAEAELVESALSSWDGPPANSDGSLPTGEQ